MTKPINKNFPLNSIVLVPEITKGMKSIGSKALIPINKNKCIIDYQIEYLQKKYKNNHITIITGFEKEKIQKRTHKYKNINYVDNPDFEYTNQGKALSVYLNKYKPQNLLIISNGILLREELELNESESTIFVLQKHNSDYLIGLNKIEKSTSYLFYDFPMPWSECVFLNRSAINTLNKTIKEKNISQMFLFEIINHLIDNNCTFQTQIIKNQNICKITTIKNTKKAKSFYA